MRLTFDLRHLIQNIKLKGIVKEALFIDKRLLIVYIFLCVYFCSFEQHLIRYQFRVFFIVSHRELDTTNTITKS